MASSDASSFLATQQGSDKLHEILTPGNAVFDVGVLSLVEPVTAETCRRVHEAVIDHGVVVVRGQVGLSDDSLRAFAQGLPGRIVPLGLAGAVEGVVRLTNLGPDGTLLSADDANVLQNRANELWHADLTFQRPRATLSLLYARSIETTGGDTQFCDTRQFWDTLDRKEQDYLASLSCVHSGAHSRRKFGLEGWEKDAPGYEPVERPLASVHPLTGRTALTIGSYAQFSAGHDEVTSQQFLDALLERATDPRWLYAHRWRTGDLLIWDNRSVLHRATPFDTARARDMRAIRLFDPENP